ncbi:MAG: AAA family ATPase, partial [Chloroflexota bacterium]|nr:AAA family ATPase [Chloroflexota bacterium]
MKAGGPTAAELFERESEVEQVAAAIDAALAGEGSVVALEGQAGIGKTSLLADASRRACDAGMRVLSARGGELEREFAYGVVRQLFEAPLAAAEHADRERWLMGAAGLAAPVVSASATKHEAAADPNAILHGLYWLSANLATERPLLLAVDDAHWADAASVGFLSYLARRVGELPILIIYASRVGEGASGELPAVIDPALVAIVLRPAALSAAATAELIAQALDQPGSEQFAQACRKATSGNPFLLNELLRALHADGIAPEDANAHRVEHIAPRTIARATLARLRQLGPAANALAFAAAVLGKSAELRYAAALAGLDEAGASEAADALTSVEILRPGRPLEFIHPIVRATVYNELAPGKRAASHKHAARLLAQDSASNVALAPHLLATEPSGDAWVVERLRAAARDVLKQAPAAACTYLQRAHDEPPAAPERFAVLLALGGAELMVRSEVSVSRSTAIDHLQQALDRAPDAQARLDAGRLLVGALALSGRVDEAMTLGQELLAGTPREDEEAKLRLEGELALLAQFSPRYAKPALERLAGYEGRLTGATRGERLILTCLAFGAAHGDRSASTAADLARLALAGDTLVDEHRPGSAAMYLAIWTLI